MKICSGLCSQSNRPHVHIGESMNGFGWTPKDLEAQFQVALNAGWVPIFRAVAQQVVTGIHSYKPEELMAIASRETGYLWSHHPDGHIIGDGGHGRGIMQIDDRSNMEFVRQPNALEPATNILKGAEILNANSNAANRMTGSEFLPDDLWHEMEYAAYNCGPKNAYLGWKNHGDPSRFTTQQNYGKDVLARVPMFAEFLAEHPA